MVENTKYAAAQREEKEVIDNQYNKLRTNNDLEVILNAFPNIVMILNPERQLVYSNKMLIAALNIENIEDILGKRPGELFNCIHADQYATGCGTSEFCRYCGAVNAIIESQAGITVSKECRIMSREGKSVIAHDLSVTAAPYKLKSENYTVFTIKDISDEKRRQTLEKIFFHDILNTASNIRLGLDVLGNESFTEENKSVFNMLPSLTDHLIDEVYFQRELMMAERNELIVEYQTFDIHDILTAVISPYSFDAFNKNKSIELSYSVKNVPIKSEPTILKRVLTNLIKNALEASKPGDKVLISYKRVNNQIEISVHNNTYILEEVRMQMFQRSFSTKGTGRGIGTYSIKILTEKYLKGEVSFSSTPEKGTTFFICLPENQDSSSD